MEKHIQCFVSTGPGNGKNSLTWRYQVADYNKGNDFA